MYKNGYIHFCDISLFDIVNLIIVYTAVSTITISLSSPIEILSEREESSDGFGQPREPKNHSNLDLDLNGTGYRKEGPIRHEHSPNEASEMKNVRDNVFSCDSEENCSLCRPHIDEQSVGLHERSRADDYMPVFIENPTVFTNFVHYSKDISNARISRHSSTDVEHSLKRRRISHSNSNSAPEFSHSPICYKPSYTPPEHTFLPSKFYFPKPDLVRHEHCRRESSSHDFIENAQRYKSWSPVENEIYTPTFNEHNGTANSSRRSCSPGQTSCSSKPGTPISPLHRRSPSGPFSPTTPVPMCLPISNSSCESFQHPYYGCSVPSPCCQRFPYYFPPPFSGVHSEVRHLNNNASVDSKVQGEGTDLRRKSQPKHQRGDNNPFNSESSCDSVENPIETKEPPSNQLRDKSEQKVAKSVLQKSHRNTSPTNVPAEDRLLSSVEKNQAMDENEIVASEKIMTTEEEQLEHFKSTKGRKFTCKFCGKVYVSLGALKMHIRTHTLPCKCHICGKAFSRPWLLQGHIRTHTGEKPYKCHMCQRAFADRSNLRAHLQTHSDVKKYSCKTCHKTFSRMSLLLKHEEAGCLVS